MIYISGAITGTTDYMERFAKAEDALYSMGYVPINPAKVNAQLPAAITYSGYMKMSLAMLDLCDSIFMLNGWEKSNGANLEWLYAITMGKRIIYEDETQGQENE